MQLFALNEKGESIFFQEAEVKVDYFCMECGGSVRLRAGNVRQHHFYHVGEKGECRQQGKSLEHIQTQLVLKKRLGEGCKLEQRFGEIERIADVCCPERKLIVEVQCSPITAEEIAARNRDYESLGYQVVWILHDKRYNRRQVKGAERYLEGHPHYFTDINAFGEGRIYDQLSRREGAVRVFRSKELTVDLTQSFPMPKHPPLPIKRLKTWPFYFRGDHCERFLLYPASPFSLAALEGERKVRKPYWKRLFLPIRLFFRYLLEKACD